VYIDKTEQKSFIGHKWGDPFTEEQIKYAGEDVEHLIPLYDILTKKHIDRDMKDLATLEYEVVRVSGDMELNGIFINKDKWLFLQKEALVRADSAFKDLNAYFKKVCETDLFGDPVINYGSPLQVRPALEKILGKEIAGTGAAILKSLRSPATDALLKYREATKKVSTYGEAFLEKHIHPSDLRIHARFAQLGAGTGRFAGRTPNLMNIPKEKEYRAAFTAQYPDYRIIAADFSGQDNEIFYLFSA
jgi:DNA polymerase I-like protein with 3'-5' exonuclease and polymerase domains